MTALAIKNVGSIHHLELDLPDESGGVLVLKGKNAAGKSTAIEIIRCLLAGKGRLETRDGAPKGSAEGFGKRANVGQKTTWGGESEVPSLEGRFDFSDLVLPRGEKAETRDGIRIKALLSLVGAKADPTLFYELTGGNKEQFEKIVPATVLKTTDLVELAGQVARAFQAAARTKESDAEHALAHQRACQEAAGDADPDQPVVMDKLHANVHQAATALQKLESRQKTADENEQALREARAKLDAETSSYQGPATETAAKAMQEAVELLDNAETLVRTLEEQVRLAKEVVADRRTQRSERTREWEKAYAHDRLVAELTLQIANTQREEPPSIVELSLARETVAAAKKALEDGITHGTRIVKANEAKAHKLAVEAATKAATALREAAHSVDAILSTQLPPGPLRADAGRMVLDTERGEGVPFDECSQGEKYTVALPYGIRSVGKGGYLALIQDGWQDLDSDNRRSIAEQCRAAKVWLITGEVADGELRAEPFQLEA